MRKLGLIKGGEAQRNSAKVGGNLEKITRKTTTTSKERFGKQREEVSKLGENRNQ